MLKEARRLLVRWLLLEKMPSPDSELPITATGKVEPGKPGGGEHSEWSVSDSSAVKQGAMWSHRGHREDARKKEREG